MELANIAHTGWRNVLEANVEEPDGSRIDSVFASCDICASSIVLWGVVEDAEEAPLAPPHVFA